MSESTTTIFLITGATRGIGKKSYVYIPYLLLMPLFFCDPSGPGAFALKQIAEKCPGRVEIVKYVAADEEGTNAIAQEIQNRHGRVDVVIANAAILGALAPVHELNIDAYKEHFSVNVIGTVVLFKAFYHLLKASANPKFVPITSIGGSLTLATPGPVYGTCYGSSKAALNWVTRKIHFENKWIVCFPLSPGSVETDMLDTLITEDTTRTFTYDIIRRNGVLSAEAAADALVDIIVAATRESEGGQVVHVDGSRFPW